MKLLERALLSAKRLDDPDLVTDGCILAWNVGLPLLQPHLRRQVHRIFLLAASVLEEIASPLSALRASLHFEVARCELAVDFLAKAKTHVQKALALDYGAVGGGGDPAPNTAGTPPQVEDELVKKALAAAEQMRLRPLDKYLEPMQEKLLLKSSLYSEPEGAEEKAMLFIEQARDAKDKSLKMTLLGRAATTLSQAERDNTGGASSVGVKTSTQITRLELWSDITTLAWEEKILLLSQAAARFVVSDTSWDAVEHKHILQLQAKAHIVVAETLILQIRSSTLPALRGVSTLDKDWNEVIVQAVKDVSSPSADVIGKDSGGPGWKGLRTLGVMPSLEGGSDDGSVVDTKLFEQVKKIKTLVITHLVASLRLGKKMQDKWTVENAVIYLWNVHLGLYQTNSGSGPRFALFLPALVEALEESCSTLLAVRSNDSRIIFQIAEAVSLCFEFQKSYDKAEDICTKAISLHPHKPLAIMPLVSVRARVQQQKTGKEPAMPENKFAQVIVLLQMLEGERDAKKSDAGVSKAMSLLETAQEEQRRIAEKEDAGGGGGVAAVQTLEDYLQWVELRCQLWTRLARVSLDASNVPKAQACCEKAIAELPASPEGRKTLSANVWRWLSLAANIQAQAVEAVISPEGQEKSLQDELRLACLHHLCLAAEWGTQAALPSLVADASAHVWNVALPLMDSPEGRQVLFSPLRQVLKQLALVCDRSNVVLQARLYCLLFECFNDAAKWEEGLQCVEEAFQIVPSSYQKPLWQFRVVFTSKMGRSVLDGLSKMKETDPQLQARVWTTLARSAAKEEDQFQAPPNPYPYPYP